MIFTAARRSASVETPFIEQIFEQVLSGVINAVHGYIECPGRHRHTTADAEHDCKVFFNPDGTIIASCFHHRCASEIRHLNALLFQFTSSTGRSTAPSKTRHSKLSTPPSAEAKTGTRFKSLAEIVASHPWTSSAMQQNSPVSVALPEANHWQMLLRHLFLDTDIIWCGRDIQDSGSPGHRSRFRAVGDWLTRAHCPGPFTCPSTFKSGIHSRSNANVAESKYLVLESDTLKHHEIGAVFRWLNDEIGIPLRAVVDTAGKSLHGWFDYPRAELLAELKTRLPELGCDPCMFKPSQPCRLPGALRDGRYQRLLYLSAAPVTCSPLSINASPAESQQHHERP